MIEFWQDLTTAQAVLWGSTLIAVAVWSKKRGRVMLKRLRSRLTMVRDQYLFLDKESGKEVFLWVDCYGVEYLCGPSRWGVRVRHY